MGSDGGGQIWSLQDAGSRWITKLLLRIASFAEQPDGELLVVDHTGGVYRIVAR